MKQSRRASLIEVCVSIGTGFAFAMIVQVTVAWWWNFPLSLGDNFVITSIFTIVSIIRSYLFRRLFEYLRVKEILK